MKNKSLMQVLGLFVGTSLLMSSMAFAGHEKKAGQNADAPCESKHDGKDARKGDSHGGSGEEGKAKKAGKAD